MGLFTSQITVSDIDRTQWETVDAVVDTGASYSIIPADALHRLGVVPLRKDEYETADGRTIECDIGVAWVNVDGRETTTPVVFGIDDSLALLGAVTLQELNLAVDTKGERLVPGGRLRY